MTFENDLNQLLPIIDLILCDINEKRIVVYDTKEKSKWNDVLPFPVSFISFNQKRKIQVEKDENTYTIIINTNTSIPFQITINSNPNEKICHLQIATKNDNYYLTLEKAEELNLLKYEKESFDSKETIILLKEKDLEQLTLENENSKIQWQKKKKETNIEILDKNELVLTKEIEKDHDLYAASCLSSMNQIVQEIHNLLETMNHSIFPFLQKEFPVLGRMNDLLDLSYDADLLDFFYKGHKNIIH